MWLTQLVLVLLQDADRDFIFPICTPVFFSLVVELFFKISWQANVLEFIKFFHDRGEFRTRSGICRCT